jgi:protein involved in polysaccharide export with SLBB domain
MSQATGQLAAPADQFQGDQGQGDEMQSDQQGFSDTPNQAAMSPSQIISILQGNPEALNNLKTIAGEDLGIDPSTISDQGIYNCVRVDPNFRAQISAELQNQGFVANPQSNEMGVGGMPGRQSGGRANGQSLQQGVTPNGQQRSPEVPSDVRTQQPIPYRNIPSLRDLYSQDVAVTTNLRRFGSDTFEFGTGNVDELPMDLPAGPDYVLGPGDSLVVNMWGGQSSRFERTVDRQGQIALPAAGPVTVSGLSIAQAQSAIQQALGTQFQNEHVELSLGRVRTVRVYVVGDVQRPGAYDVSSLSTPLNALYAAGGPTSRGSLRTLRHMRSGKLEGEIDLYDFFLHGVRPDSARLLPGDTILVPPVGPQVTVAGMVRRPAIYELKADEDLKEVLNLAGGVLVSANLQQINVERVVAHQSRTMLSVSIPQGAGGAPPQIPAFTLQDGDKVTVLPILPYNEKVVYLDGHVFKPGPYPWREGMTVSDLLPSYQEVMPEPANHAEIIRLLPPDFRPETISFNLPDELTGNDPVTLQPFDVVRVYGRYEIDPPKVSIYGEVLRPGEYPMSQGMTVAGLVRMGGGFRRSAYQKEADLSSYVVQNGQNVLVRHQVVDIQKALEGDKSADVVLHPGDIVGIRQLTGWKDIGASVTVDGEVSFAGTYGIEVGERLSSVLKRAGGFRDDAYPDGAILERVQVRQMEENNRQEMIRRVQNSIPTVASGLSTPQEQQNLLQTMQQQQQEVLASLRGHSSTGRLVIKISGDISKWENTPADIEMRAGDKLTIPKRPDFVLVSGQVYNATGITYRPGKDARWYLRQAGGATRSGDKRNIFIVRADGSVVSGQGGAFFGNSVLDVHLHPGDSIVVPEKVMGGSQLWRNLIGTAQIMSSVALTGAVAGAF